MESTYIYRPTNHLLHLTLTGMTCGLWGPVWFCVWLYNLSSRRRIVTYRNGFRG